MWAAGEEAKVSFPLDQLHDDRILEEIDGHFTRLLEQTGIPLEKVHCGKRGHARAYRTSARAAWNLPRF